MTEIPNFKTLNIQHIVCDYNGTIAKGGADIICKNIEDALSLFIHTKRLIATLRR